MLRLFFFFALFLFTFRLPPFIYFGMHAKVCRNSRQSVSKLAGYNSRIASMAFNVRKNSALDTIDVTATRVVIEDFRRSYVVCSTANMLLVFVKCCHVSTCEPRCRAFAMNYQDSLDILRRPLEGEAVCLAAILCPYRHSGAVDRARWHTCTQQLGLKKSVKKKTTDCRVHEICLADCRLSNNHIGECCDIESTCRYHQVYTRRRASSSVVPTAARMQNAH